MNPPKELLRTLLATFKWALSVLPLLVCSAALLSCKPAALPATFSSSIILPPTLTEAALRQMLATKAVLVKQENETAMAPLPTLYPPSTRLPKPIPIPAQSAVPPPTAFAPFPDGTPAGAGTLEMTAPIPLFYVHDFMFTNVWSEDAEAGRLRTYVYGGFIPGPGGEPSLQGVIVVQVLKMDTNGDIRQVYHQQFPTRTQSGPVRITGAVGERLILQATDGTTFYFDVPSQQFVSSLTVIVPTATVSISPLATPAPAP